MKRRLNAFTHGGSTVLSVYMIVAVTAGPEALAIEWAPPWAVVLGSLAGLLFTYRDMKRAPDEMTVISRVCENCEPERSRGAFD